MKNVSTYVEKLDDSYGFSVDNIVVEHRSNNPKRDFLFVNKAQCMHIPNRPGMIIDMCKKLAARVEARIPQNQRILVIGFAETATAIGNLVADNLPGCKFVMTTTREDYLGGKIIIKFNEEHSHATSQRLETYNHIDIINDFDYILFVEDEISTGKTILNFIDAFEKYAKGKGSTKKLCFGVASVCNWQNEENHKKFSKRNIDVFALVYGQLKDAEMKMNVENYRTEPFNDKSFKEAKVSKVNTSTMVEERFGHAPNRDLKDLMNAIYTQLKDYSDKHGFSLSYAPIRVVGTEESKYYAVKVAEYLDGISYYCGSKLSAICQSTTRSPIDVLGFGNPYEGIISKYRVPSVYEKDRPSYIYNTDINVSMNIIITDAVVTKAERKEFKKVLGPRCIFVTVN